MRIGQPLHCPICGMPLHFIAGRRPEDIREAGNPNDAEGGGTGYVLIRAIYYYYATRRGSGTSNRLGHGGLRLSARLSGAGMDEPPFSWPLRLSAFPSPLECSSSTLSTANADTAAATTPKVGIALPFPPHARIRGRSVRYDHLTHDRSVRECWPPLTDEKLLLLAARPGNPLDVPLVPGFVMHESCWQMLAFALKMAMPDDGRGRRPPEEDEDLLLAVAEVMRSWLDQESRVLWFGHDAEHEIRIERLRRRMGSSSGPRTRPTILDMRWLVETESVPRKYLHDRNGTLTVLPSPSPTYSCVGLDPSAPAVRMVLPERMRKMGPQNRGILPTISIVKTCGLVTPVTMSLHGCCRRFACRLSASLELTTL